MWGRPLSIHLSPSHSSLLPPEDGLQAFHPVLGPLWQAQPGVLEEALPLRRGAKRRTFRASDVARHVGVRRGHRQRGGTEPGEEQVGDGRVKRRVGG